MAKLRALDGCCKQGGAGWGLHLAGFEVLGVDREPQPHYPLAFRLAEIVAFICEHGHEFDLLWVSPPCQAASGTQRIQGNQHVDIIPQVREALVATDRPYVIENVVGAELVDPIMLCGAMFGLRTYRHRLFESNVPLIAPVHPGHAAPTTKMGRPVRDGEFMHVVGNFHGASLGREVMGMPWATRDGLREAIPPAYSRWIGQRIVAALAHG